MTVDNGNTRPSLVCEPHYLFNWSAPTVDNADGSAHSRVPRAVVVLLAPACARALVRCTLVFVCCRLLLRNQALDFSFAGLLRNTCSSLVFGVNRASLLSANCGRIRSVLKLFSCVFLCQSFAPVSQFLAFCFLWFPQEECREPSCVLKSFPFSLAPAYESYRLFFSPTFLFASSKLRVPVTRFVLLFVAQEECRTLTILCAWSVFIFWRILNLFDFGFCSLFCLFLLW